jgi:hypothetical protein
MMREIKMKKTNKLPKPASQDVYLIALNVPLHVPVLLHRDGKVRGSNHQVSQHVKLNKENR